MQTNDAYVFLGGRRRSVVGDNSRHKINATVASCCGWSNLSVTGLHEEKRPQHSALTCGQCGQRKTDHAQINPLDVRQREIIMKHVYTRYNKLTT